MKFPRSGVLIAIGRISIVFDFGPEANTVASEEVIARWVPKLFPPLFVPRVLALANQGRVVFFQGQLRFLAAEVMRLPKSDTEDETFFRACKGRTRNGSIDSSLNPKRHRALVRSAHQSAHRNKVFTELVACEAIPGTVWGRPC